MYRVLKYTAIVGPAMLHFAAPGPGPGAGMGDYYCRSKRILGVGTLVSHSGMPGNIVHLYLYRIASGVSTSFFSFF